MQLSSYLYFDGQCEEAFKVYESVLGGRIVMMLRYADAPSDQPVSAGTGNRIMHARLLAGNRLLMGSDTPNGLYRKPQGFSVSLNVDTPQEAERVYAALADGGSVQRPMAETFFAYRFAMVEDRFAIPWIVSCEKTGDNSTAEPGKPFVLSRTLDAPRDLVWKALTEPDRMRQWWGPERAQSIAATMDLRPGGSFHYGLRMPDGREMWGLMLYRAIAAPERLIFVNAFSDAKGGLTRQSLAPDWPLQMLSKVFLAERGEKTSFTIEWSPLDATAAEQAAFDAGHGGMTAGWAGTLDRLEAYLAKAKVG